MSRETAESKQFIKLNYEVYSEYLMNLIPKDEDKNQKYVALVERKDGDDPRFSKSPNYAIIEDLPPIPIRFLRKDDCFI